MDRSSSTTVARFIRRFRDSQPLSREDRRKERESLEVDIWWTRPHVEAVSAPTPAPNLRNEVVGESKPPEQEESAFFSDSNREDHREDHETPDSHREDHREDQETRQEDSGHDSESDDPKGGPQTAEQTPVSAVSLMYPTSQGLSLCGKTSAGVAEGEPNALDIVNDVSGTVAAAMLARTNIDENWSDQDCRPASGNCVTAATSSAGVYSDSYERGGDKLASLDIRARTLLEDCRRVLASPPSSSHKELMREGLIPAEEGDVSVGIREDSHGSCSIEGLEERAWLLLNGREEQAVHPGDVVPSSSRERAELFVPRESLVGPPCAGESPLNEDCGEMQMLPPQHDACWTSARRLLAKGNNTYPCQQGPQCEGGVSAEVRHSGNVGLDFAFEKPSVGKDYMLDEDAGSISTFASSSEGLRRLSPRALATSVAEADYFRKDPVLSALLRRFGEIENELERRCSPRREDKPNGDYKI